METKPWQQSKTIWFNVIMTLLLIAPIVGAFVKILEPDQVALIDGILAVLAGVGNVILRVWFTDTPIQTAKNPGLPDQSDAAANVEQVKAATYQISQMKRS